MSNTPRTTAPTAARFYAAAYPFGCRPGAPRTLRVFCGLATRSAFVAARMSDHPAGDGYRCTLQARDLTPTERRALSTLSR
jgi:hypothetical protein